VKNHKKRERSQVSRIAKAIFKQFLPQPVPLPFFSLFVSNRQHLGGNGEVLMKFLLKLILSAIGNLWFIDSFVPLK